MPSFPAYILHNLISDYAICITLNKPAGLSCIPLIFAASLLYVAGHANGQLYDGSLILDPIPSSAPIGSEVVFSGQLVTSSGHAVAGAVIYIKDDVALGADTVIHELITDDNGQFEEAWTAVSRRSGAWDFYAVFEGDDVVSKARSNTHSITVLSGSDSAVQPDGSSVQAASHTNLVLDVIQSTAYAGESVVFSGILTSGAEPIPGAHIKILEDDPLKFDELLATATTDHNGRFLAYWNVGAGLIEEDFDIYASFDGALPYKPAKTPNQQMAVFKHGGSITLDPLPRSVGVGATVTFSGTLNLDSRDPEGAIVYIKDEDPLSPDDLIATAYVDHSGTFSADWFAVRVDVDGEADIYAVFEGTDTLYRLTTCDDGPTGSLGGLCSNTIPITISGTHAPTVPTPAPTPTPERSGDAYMELYYALNFNRPPHVVISPSPDSYDEVSKHIVPVQEGILIWTDQLEGRFGGDWLVTFDVLEPGQAFDSRPAPDVIVNLVTRNDDPECLANFYGYAIVSPFPRKPIQTTVCSGDVSDSQVGATAAHEFIHAVGLGHAFNKAGDMMCSVEDGIATCENLLSKSQTPSELNLDAVIEIYGVDGFLSPNNRVSYQSKFYDQSSGNAVLPMPPVVADPDFVDNSGTQPDFNSDESGSVSGNELEIYVDRGLGFSIKHPVDWDVDDEYTEFEPAPDYHGGITDAVTFYDDINTWYYRVAVSKITNDVEFKNLRGQQYLDRMADMMAVYCKDATLFDHGYTCSKHAVIDSKITEIDGKTAYQVKARWTENNSYDLIPITGILTYIPVADDTWSLYIESVTSEYPRRADTFKLMLDSFDVSDDAPQLEYEPPQVLNELRDAACGPGTVMQDGVCVAKEAEPMSGDGGCLIATAAYGSELSEPIQQLRELRDGTLLRTKSGVAFIAAFNSAYYSFSPTVADWERQSPILKELVRLAAAPLIHILSILNYVDIDTEWDMIGYGTGTILIILGMYVGIPMATIRAIRRLV